MAPYHEFECTGLNDQFIQEIDETEETRKEYEEYKQPMLESPDGEQVSRYDARFYFPPDAPEFLAYAETVIPDKEKRDKVIADMQRPMGLMGMGWGNGFSYDSKDWGDGKGYSGRVRVIPPGWTEVQVPPDQTFAEWVADYQGKAVLKSGEKPDIGPEGESRGSDHAHKYGWVEVDEKGEVVKVIRRTNNVKYLSTICPGVGTNPTNHAKGIHQEERSTRNEVLPQVSDTEDSGGVLQGDSEPGREVRVLSTLPEGEEPNANPGSASSVAFVTDVSALMVGVSDVAQFSGRPLRDMLPSGDQQPAAVGGSLPQDGEGSGVTLQELQHRAGQAGGQYQCAACGDQLPHAPHVTKQVLIGGAKWDYYRMGGRYGGRYKLKRKIIPLLGNGGVQDSGVSGLTAGEFENLRNLFNESRYRFDRIAQRYGEDKYHEIKDAIVAANAQAAGALPPHKKAPKDWDGPEDKGEEYVDQARKEDIDWDAMRTEAAQAANARYDHFESVIGEHKATTKTFDQVQADMGVTDEQLEGNHDLIDKVRAAYHAQPGFVACHNDRELFWDLNDFLSQTREIYVKLAVDRVGTTFAVVKDGKWYEKGEMGWWACVSNEKDDNEWITQVRAMLDELPGDTLLTVCDCHI